MLYCCHTIMITASTIDIFEASELAAVGKSFFVLPAPQQKIGKD